MLCLFLLAIICLILFAAVGLILYARRDYGILEKMNIPVIKPHFFLGSVPDLHLKLQQFEDIKRYREFGSVYGMYEGSKPQVYVCDPELSKLVFVKDYEHFKHKPGPEFGHSIINSALDFLPYEQWKHVRSIWTHAFSAKAIKNYGSSVERLSEELAQELRAECNGKPMEFDIRGKFVVILADLMTSSLLGVSMKDRKDPNNYVIKLMRELLCENVRYTPVYNLTLVFPFLKKFFLPFISSGPDNLRLYMNNILNARKAQNNNNEPAPANFKDVGDSLLDMKSKLGSEEYSKLGLTDDMIMGFAAELFFAVYDSTGTAMTFLIYYLTQFPEIQDRVLDEIDSVVEELDGKIGHDFVAKLPYLNACFNETMRLTPPFVRAERQCTKDWEHNGLKIPKGMTVVMPIFAANRNPEIFPNPDEFDPDRFLPENKDKLDSYGFSTFGFGPKMCPGNKLAYEMSLIILARLLKDFRFEPTLETKNVDFKPGTIFFIQYKPIIVNIVPRY